MKKLFWMLPLLVLGCKSQEDNESRERARDLHVHKRMIQSKLKMDAKVYNDSSLSVTENETYAALSWPASQALTILSDTEKDTKAEFVKLKSLTAVRILKKGELTTVVELLEPPLERLDLLHDQIYILTDKLTPTFLDLEARDTLQITFKDAAEYMGLNEQ